MKPTKKVTSAGVGGAIVTLAVFVLRQFEIEASPEVASSAAMVASFVLGWLKRD